jgi:phospholipid/cholesterol/gamma-HCH transport system substrate-binding protein
MTARKNETVVGIFVVASLIALLVMVAIIAQQEGLFQQYVEYRAIFKNVSNLKPASEVHLAGVTVGDVTKIVINPEGTIVVTFRVTKKYSDQIRQDSQASIGFMGLLGDKSLELTAGSQDKPPLPPEGLVAVVEPLDITQLLAKAAPSLDDLQKILSNLASLTSDLGKSGGDLPKILAEVRQIVTKINEGKGTLGLIVNDPTLFKEATQTVAGAKKLVTGLDQGVVGALAGTPSKEKAQQTLADLNNAATNASRATGTLREAVARLPDIMKKLDEFLTNLNKAGKGLPALVTEGETAASDFDKTTKAMQKSWLLRRHVPIPQEHTILMDAAPGKD